MKMRADKRYPLNTFIDFHRNLSLLFSLSRETWYIMRDREYEARQGSASFLAANFTFLARDTFSNA